ncbi:MAG: MFS transporter [Myxococcaceae bacterium]|nr:MFS transporter [Myxococcaceae bacterium]
MTDSSASATSGRGVLGALAVYFERRTLVMLALGFAAGLPNLLIFDTLSAWLREAGLSLEVIGFFSLATLAYSFKFLWAPLVDRTTVPGLTRLLGHRRSWMLLCQVLIILGLWLVAGTDPASHLGLMALFAVFVGFSSATQDIVVDAWRIESAEDTRQGALAAAYQWGYRIAMIVAGAVPLLLAESYGWSFSYATMAALMGVGVLAVVFAPREAQHQLRPIHVQDVREQPVLEVLEWFVRLGLFALGALVLGSGLSGNASLLARALGALGLDAAGQELAALWTARPWGVWLQLMGVLAGGGFIYLAARPIPGAPTRPGVYLGKALGEPLANFFSRFGKTAGLILALICVYRLSDFVLNIMNPFYLDMAFTKTEIAEVRKVYGVIMSMLGVFLGGFAIARWGLMRPLIVGAFSGPITNLIFVWLATRGHDVGALVVAISVDNLASGFSGTCLIAYMSSLTSAGFTATQYALFSSLYALPGKLIASQSGRIVESAARSAEEGGLFAPLADLFGGMSADAFVQGAAATQVKPASLGAGYAVFFIYSCLVGVAAIVLSLMIARRQQGEEAVAGPTR